MGRACACRPAGDRTAGRLGRGVVCGQPTPKRGCVRAEARSYQLLETRLVAEAGDGAESPPQPRPTSFEGGAVNRHDHCSACWLSKRRVFCYLGNWEPRPAVLAQAVGQRR
jgi:hypothetical protein